MSRRLAREKKTVSAMIRLYCLEHHKSDGGQELLCRNCGALESYAHERVDHCPYGDNKPSCGQCITPCYAQVKREAIRKVMKNTRRKMLYHHPVLTYYHLKDYFGSKRKSKR